MENDPFTEKLIRWSNLYTVEYIVTFDVRFQQLIFEHGHLHANPWMQNSSELFSEVFNEAAGCRLGSAAGTDAANGGGNSVIKQWQPNNQKHQQQKRTGPYNKYTRTKDGKNICYN